MSYTIGYLRKNARVPQRSEFTASKDENNTWQCNFVFICRDSDVKALTPNAGDKCPRSEFKSLECVSSSATSLSNQPYTKIVSNYAGLEVAEGGGSGGTESEKTFTTSRSVSSDPIETHKLFKDLTADQLQFASDFKSGNVRIEGEGDSKKYFVIRKNASSVEYKKEVEVSGALETLIEFLAKGITSYFSPRIDLTATWTSSTSADNNSKVGKIDTPPNGAPTLKDGANWLNTGGSSTKQGGLQKHNESWKSSASGGWNEKLYT